MSASSSLRCAPQPGLPVRLNDLAHLRVDCLCGGLAHAPAVTFDAQARWLARCHFGPIDRLLSGATGRHSDDPRTGQSMFSPGNVGSLLERSNRPRRAFVPTDVGCEDRRLPLIGGLRLRLIIGVQLSTVLGTDPTVHNM